MATSGVPLWSTTASNNATADPAVNMAEGMAASAVNDSGRALMASVAKWRNDLYGITTGGTSTAYTVATGSTFLTAADMSGVVFTILPHATSGASPTLAVDGLTARALNVSTGVAVPTGALVSGTPYLVKYVHASTEFIVLGGVAAFGTLAVTGASTFTGAVTANGGVSSTTGAFSAVLTQSSTSHGMLAAGTTAQRPGTPAAAQYRYNSTTGFPEFYSATGWVSPGKAPTVQVFNSGTSATYTTPANVAYIRVRAVAGGGGGGGSGTVASGGLGVTGGTTTFNSVNAIGGFGGNPNSTSEGGTGGVGGTGGTGAATVRFKGGNGGGGGGGIGGDFSGGGIGGSGGASVYGGAGGGGHGYTTIVGTDASPNSGAGGGGASGPNSLTGGAAGGGAGEYFELIIGTPAATYVYSVGAAGAGGSAGTSGSAGGAGAAGRIIVDEYYA